MITMGLTSSHRFHNSLEQLYEGLYELQREMDQVFKSLSDDFDLLIDNWNKVLTLVRDLQLRRI